MKNLYELDRHTSYDVPQWSGVMPSFEVYCAQLEAYVQAGSFLAWHGDELIGLSFMEPDGYISYMGVARVYQRQGVALALKLLTIQWAKEHGLTHLRSTNNAASEPILSLNRRLGYSVSPGPIYLIKDVTGPVTVLKEVAKTVGTLALFIGLYAWWKPYGLGIGAIFLLHELGHIAAGRLRGMPLSFPTFIPFVGAFVTWKKKSPSAFDRAFVAAGARLPGSGCF